MCVRACRCSSSLRVNRLPQKTQLHTKGLSPVCNLTCALRSDVFRKVFSHPGTWQMCFLFPTSPGLWPGHGGPGGIRHSFKNSTDKRALLQFVETCTSRPPHVSHSPLVCVFTVGTRARHAPLLFPRLAGQFQREGLVYLQGGLAWRGCQLQPRALHGLHRQMLLA